MFESFSAVGFFVQTPCGPRKSGIPDSVEIPAPVRPTTYPASRNQLVMRSRSVDGTRRGYRSEPANDVGGGASRWSLWRSRGCSVSIAALTCPRDRDFPTADRATQQGGTRLSIRVPPRRRRSPAGDGVRERLLLLHALVAGGWVDRL